MTAEPTPEKQNTPSPFPELAYDRLSLRVARGYRIFAYLFTPVGVGVAGWLAYMSIAEGWSGSERNIVGLALGGIMFVGMLFILLAAVRSRLEIDANTIRLTGPVRTRELLLSQVVGVRKLNVQNVDILRFVARDEGLKDVDVHLQFERKDDFVTWAYTQFDDLDAIDFNAARQKLLKDEKLGANEAERLRTLKRTNRCAIGYGLATVLYFFWLLLKPSPYGAMMTISLLLPFVGIGLLFRFRGAMQLDEQNNRAIPAIGAGLIMALVSPLLRGMKDWSLLDWAPLALPACGIAAFLLLIIIFAEPTIIRKRGLVVSYALFCLMYGVGAALFLNGYLHNTELQRLTTVVYVEKHEGNCHHLRIAAPGEYFEDEELDLPKRLEKILQEGDAVEVVVKEGWLGAKRYFVVAGDS